MRFIEPHVEWWPQTTLAHHIARVGRICYKAKGKQPEERNAKVEKENDNLRKQIEQLESFNAELDATVKEQTEMLNGGKLYEDYQEVCIKNSKLNATVDVLVEKISMLKAVGCHG